MTTDNAPNVTQTCPRRMEEFGPWEHKEGLDTWKERDGASVCSFCGSLNPEVFLDKAAAGAEIEPTDKSYKAYLDKNQKFYFQHFSREQRIEFVRRMNAKELKLAYPGHFYVLPFFARPDGGK